MTEILAESRPGVRVEKINVLAWAHCGDGIASTADRVSLDLIYEEGADAGLPNRVILKTILLHKLLRFGLPVIMTQSRVLKALDVVPLLNRVTRPAIFTLVNISWEYRVLGQSDTERLSSSRRPRESSKDTWTHWSTRRRKRL